MSEREYLIAKALHGLADEDVDKALGRRIAAGGLAATMLTGAGVGAAKVVNPAVRQGIDSARFVGSSRALDDITTAGKKRPGLPVYDRAGWIKAGRPGSVGGKISFYRTDKPLPAGTTGRAVRNSNGRLTYTYDAR